jgi:hypothetical protein
MTQGSYRYELTGTYFPTSAKLLEEFAHLDFNSQNYCIDRHSSSKVTSC